MTHLHDIHADHVSEVIYVRGERVEQLALPNPRLELWDGFVSTANGVLPRRAVHWFIPAREPEVNEVVLHWT